MTNGDNEYGEGFFHQVAEAGRKGKVDIVAFDFYSRFQRITAPSCVRFHAWEGAPACKRNRLRWCHTDLGTNVLNYPRFVREQRRFGGLQAVAGEGVTADHFDGIMAQDLIRGGWRVRNLEGVCLFEHSPSFHSCAWRGGVWDDRDVVSWHVAGGRCISHEEAAEILASDPNAEEVLITPSTDNRQTGQPAGLRGGLPACAAEAARDLLPWLHWGPCEGGILWGTAMPAPALWHCLRALLSIGWAQQLHMPIPLVQHSRA